jgi:hypothetical protein
MHAKGFRNFYAKIINEQETFCFAKGEITEEGEGN